MAKRLAVQTILEKLVSHVYFQPPEGLKLVYPCIVYTMAAPSIRRANNISTYVKHERYDLTYITKVPEDPKADEILDSFEFISYDRIFITDNLYHHNYTIFM